MSGKVLQLGIGVRWYPPAQASGCERQLVHVLGKVLGTTWNYLAIRREGSPDYLLGQDMRILVIQEVKEDCKMFQEEQSLDPIEVTMDKTIKKELLQALAWLPDGGETYWDLVEDEDVWNDGTEDYDNFDGATSSTTSVSTTTTESSPNQPMRPKVPGQKEIHHRGRPRPGNLSYDFELKALLREFPLNGEPVEWINHLGHVMLVTTKVKGVIIPRVGPGARHLRWTACCDGHGEWTWIEEGKVGRVEKKVYDYEKAVVIYRWPTPSNISEVYVQTTDITNKEKAEVIRCHVNLGHPSAKEFVRLLKAAGTREDAIQYVVREFQCAGCHLEKRQATRLPAATPRTYDFNVVIGVDVLFVHGIDNKAEHPVLNITCCGTLYSTFGLIDVQRRTAELTWKAFTRLWLRTFGAPQFGQ